MAEASSVDDLDVPVAVESETALQSIVQRSEAPVMEESQVLLCNLASIYTTQASPAGPPSNVAFIRGLLKVSGGSIASVMEVVNAAEELEEGDGWTVDSKNCLATLLALADRQPSALTLVARPDEPEALPAAAVAAVAKAARDCQVQVRFFDSFFKPEDTARDLYRLEHLTKNTSLSLITFYGHLNSAGIDKLPSTIHRLGLAIGSAADARAVSGLRLWEGLAELVVSVCCGVAAQDLRPLPSVETTYLYFPGLTDARVDSVRPAIEALVGDKGFYDLCLPVCQLTAAGARRLARLLRGVRISDTLFIGASSPWRPRAEERESVDAEFNSAVGCRVWWGLDWLDHG